MRVSLSVSFLHSFFFSAIKANWNFSIFKLVIIQERFQPLWQGYPLKHVIDYLEPDLPGFFFHRGACTGRCKCISKIQTQEFTGDLQQTYEKWVLTVFSNAVRTFSIFTFLVLVVDRPSQASTVTTEMQAGLLSYIFINLFVLKQG